MEYRTKSGRVLTDEAIQKLADEAEAGYDVEIDGEGVLRRRRTLVFFECDHMRSVVRVNGAWHHIGSDGDVESPCGANFAYRQEATSIDQHHLGKAVRAVREI